MKVITRCVLDMETMEWIHGEEESYDYCGPIDKCCGPTGEEKQEASAQQVYSQKVQNNYNTLFGEQQGVMSNLNNILTPIANAGPSQQGFAAPELAALNTQALDTTGANYASAARALGGQLAGRSTAAGATGPTQALQAQLASSAAGQLSGEQLGITQADYAQGNANWQKATGGLQALNSSYETGTAAGAGTQANQSAFGEADEIAQQQAQADQAIAGGITTGAMDALTFGAGAANGGGFSGGMNALNGNS
jgi:hypothetical protein